MPLLDGKVAIVTGAGRAIGLAIAEGVAAEGAAVVIAEIDESSGEEAAAAMRGNGHDAQFVATDVASEVSVDAMVSTVLARFGRIDILVNNAALTGEEYRKPFFDYSLEEWVHVLAVNLGGMFLTVRAVYPTMREQKSGSIINIGSATIWYGIPNVTPYMASKGGVIGLTRGLARELGAHNVRVNAVTPGRVMTGQPASDYTPSDEEASVIRRRCLARPELASDLAGTVIYLASNLSSFVTGQTINVDGGMAMH